MPKWRIVNEDDPERKDVRVEYWMEVIDDEDSGYDAERAEEDENYYLYKGAFAPEPERIYESSHGGARVNDPDLAPEDVQPETFAGFVYDGKLISKKKEQIATRMAPDSAYDGTYTLIRFFYHRVTPDLKFDSVGGSAVPTQENIRYETPLEKYRPADPTRGSDTFVDWYLDSYYEEPFVFDHWQSTMPKDDLLLYAKWETVGQEYTVSYYDNPNSSNRVHQDIYPSGAPVSHAGAPYQVGDYVGGYGEFRGWFWIVPGTGIFLPFPENMPIRQDIDLYATWRADGLRVFYEAGEGNGTPPVDDNVYEIGGSAALKTPANLTPPLGKVFCGWMLLEDGFGPIYQPLDLYELYGNATFVAQYAYPNEAYRVTFEDGYGGQPPIEWSVPRGREIHLLEAEAEDIFVRDGATLLGWNEKAGAQTVQYELGELVYIDSDRTFYAVWSINRYDISFVAESTEGRLFDNGVYTASVDYDLIEHGTPWGDAITRGVPKAEPNSGYFFTGWSPEIPDPATPITGAQVYKARFQEQTAITLQAGSETKVYDAAPLTNDTITATGLDTSLYSAKGTMTAASTITDAGLVYNIIDTYQIIRKADDADVTHQFRVQTRPGMLTVSKRDLHIRAHDAQKVHGAADPQLTATVGPVPAGAAEPKYKLTREEGEEVGRYIISVVAKAEENPNYTIQTVDAEFQILPKDSMKASAADVTVVYDAQPHGIEVKVTGVDSGYTVRYSATEFGLYTPEQPKLINVGDSSLIYYEVSHPEYVTVKGVAEVTISKRPVTVTAEDKSKYVGDNDPSLTADVDNVPAGGTALDYTLERDNGETVGDYPIRITLGVNDNYTVSTTDGILTIRKRSGVMEAAAEDITVTYDAKPHGIDVMVNGVTGGYTVKYSSTEAGPYTATQPQKINVADSGKIFFEVTHGEHETVRGSATVTITKRPVTVKADDKSKYVGEADPKLTATEGNVPAGGTALDYTLKRDNGETVGDFAIRVTLGVNDNYTVTPTDGTLTIRKRSGVMTATAADVSVPYDAKPHGIVVEVSGVTGGYTVKYSETETGPYTAAQPEKINVADSGKIFFEVTHGEHETVRGVATVTITKHPVTVTAEDKFKTPGGVEPLLTASESIVPQGGTPLIYELKRKPGETAGDYPIWVVFEPEDNPNYDITPVDGKLTIGKQSGVMKATAKDVTVIYDAQPHGIDVEVTGVDSGYTVRYCATENGAYTTAQPTKINVADSGKIFFEVSHDGHETVKGFATVTIDKRDVTVTADDKTKEYGAADPEWTATVSNVPTGGAPVSYTLACDHDNIVGSYNIEVTQGNNPNYTVTPKDGTLTIKKIMLTVQVGSAIKRVNAADPKSYVTILISGTLLPGHTLQTIGLTYNRTPGTAVGDYAVWAEIDSPYYEITTNPKGKLTIRR